MPFCVANSDNSQHFSGLFHRLLTGQEVRFEQRNQPVERIKPRSVWLRSLENAVGMELSLVPEIETVFIEWDKEDGKAYRVISIVNDRNPDVRAKVYERERAVMDEFRGVDFSFRVLSRMNRDISDIVTNAGKVAYQRG